MKLALSILLVLTLTACDAVLDKAFSLMTDRKTNLVVLSKDPIVLTDKAVTLTANDPMLILGEWTSLCVVLRDGVPLQPQPVMDQIFATSLNGSKVKVDVVLNDGTRVTLHEPMEGWSRFGRILPRDELSACASASCGSKLPVGATVRSVEVSAVPKLEARGVFWQSEEDLNKLPKAPTPTVAGQRAKDSPSCRTSS